MKQNPAPPSAPIDFTPAACRARHDGWTPERQRGFIAALEQRPSVSDAAARVGKSARSAYKLRKKAGAESFADAWDRALDAAHARRIAAANIPDILEGTLVPYFYGGLQRAEYRDYDMNRLFERLRRTERLLQNRLGSSTVKHG